jgi:hypothetical protein
MMVKQTMTEEPVLLVKRCWRYVAGQPDELCAVFSRKFLRLCRGDETIDQKTEKRKALALHFFFCSSVTSSANRSHPSPWINEPFIRNNSLK